MCLHLRPFTSMKIQVSVSENLITVHCRGPILANSLFKGLSSRFGEILQRH